VIVASRTPSRVLIGFMALWNTIKQPRRREPNTPARVLIAHHLLLGDTLMLTPLLAKLRARYPDAQIVMTVPTAFAALYQGRPYGVDVLPYGLRNLGSVRRLLRHRGFDLAIVPGDNRYSWLARALDAHWIVAFAGDRPAYKSWPVDRLLPYPNEPAAWGDMVAGLVPGPPPPVYETKQWPDPDFGPFELPAKPYCVLHVGASTPLKMWEPAKWRALATKLTELEYRVVWSGGPGEQKYVDEIDPEHRFPSFAGRLELAQMWHLVKKARLLVSPDTGVAHLGRVTGTLTAVLFGPGSHIICGNGEFWRHAPAHGVTIDPFPCRDQRVLFKREIQWVRRCQRRPGECNDNRCMRSIDVEHVMSAVSTL
jgi:ADP-heptose:LPS heptosyltransferase